MENVPTEISEKDASLKHSLFKKLEKRTINFVRLIERYIRLYIQKCKNVHY